MRALGFHKMHGLGNDFVILDARERTLSLSDGDVRRIGDRHRGIGFDQLVVIETSVGSDARLLFFNPDGGRAGACGNGTRCAARLLMSEANRAELLLDTDGGRLVARRGPDGSITVAMAVPRFAWTEIPLARACDTNEVPLDVAGLPRPAAASMGNPHLVFFVDDLEDLAVEALGRRVQRDPLLPESANVGFAQLRDATRLRLRVYERGAGPTLACGSGACAAVALGIRRGVLVSPCEVELDGGTLGIAWDGTGPVEMTGPTALSFTGTIDPEMLGVVP